MANPAAGAAEETGPAQPAELVAALSLAADLASGVYRDGMNRRARPAAGGA